MLPRTGSAGSITHINTCTNNDIRNILNMNNTSSINVQ